MEWDCCGQETRRNVEISTQCGDKGTSSTGQNPGLDHEIQEYLGIHIFPESRYLGRTNRLDLFPTGWWVFMLLRGVVATWIGFVPP